MNYFTELSNVHTELKENIKEKGGFNYLPWAIAVKELRKRHPDAKINILRFDGLPFLKTECGFFVEVEVIVKDISHSCLMPVIGYNNKPIEKPNSFDINKNIQRATCKAIAMHGLGINLYTNEPLDGLVDDEFGQEVTQPEKTAVNIQQITDFFKACQSREEVKKIWESLDKEARENKTVIGLKDYSWKKLK